MKPMERFAAVLFINVVFAIGSAAAQSLALDSEAAPAVEHRDRGGAYEGVASNNSNPPAVKVAAGTMPPQVTWPGFEIIAQGRSRVFVQLTSRVETDVQSGPNQVVLVLKNARIAGRNNRRPLETRFFNTPVARAYLKKRGTDTLLMLELRSNALPVVSSQQASSGYFFVFLDFPAGQYVEPAPETATVPPSVSGNDAATRESQDSASSNLSISGKVTTHAVEKPLSEQELRALENEKPPILQHKARGSIQLGK
jgi:hypothetical protein